MVVLAEPERLAGGDPELVRDEVASGHGLGHRVLDLEPRVHLEEGRFAALRDEELARAGADVADLAREGEGGIRRAGARRSGVDGGRRRLLEDLLVAALERAVALAEVDAVPVGIEQDLDLDVAGALGQPLEDEPVVAEGGQRLASRGGERVRQAGRVADDVHPLAATAGRRLDEERVADAGSPPSARRGVRLVRAVVARAGPGRRAVRPGSGPRPCRPSPGSPPAADRPSAARPPRRPRRSRRSRRGTRSPDGPRRRRPPGRPRRRRRCRAGRRRPGRRSRARSARIPSRSQVRRMRAAISPRFAMNRVRIGRGSRPARPVGRPAPRAVGVPSAMNASNATDATRQRPPTRRAGSRPLAIQRWTDRVVVPIRARGLARTQFVVHRVAIVASPDRGWQGRAGQPSVPPAPPPSRGPRRGGSPTRPRRPRPNARRGRRAGPRTRRPGPGTSPLPAEAGGSSHGRSGNDLADRLADPDELARGPAALEHELQRDEVDPDGLRRLRTGHARMLRRVGIDDERAVRASGRGRSSPPPNTSA